MGLSWQLVLAVASFVHGSLGGLVKQLPTGCDPVTYTMPGFENWLHLDTISCLLIHENSATFCATPDVPSGTINGTGPSYSISQACCACPSPSASPSASASITASISMSNSASISKSSSRTGSPSRTASNTPTISVTPSISPSPSLTPQAFGECPNPEGAIRCPYQADELVWPVHISNAGSLTSVIGEAGKAEFVFTNAESLDGSLWLKTRCQTGGSDSWFVNGNIWYAQHSSAFMWQEYGTIPGVNGTHTVTLEAREPNCEILAVYLGQNGQNLGSGLLVDDCDDGPARGYLCPTEMSVAAPVIYDQSTNSILSLSSYGQNQGASTTLHFNWNPEFGAAGLWFYTNCAGANSDSWFVNGNVWDVPWSNDGEFHWHRYGSTSDPVVFLAAREPNCRIRFAYLGVDQPDETAVPQCPLDAAKCPSEAELSGFHLKGYDEEDIYGDCNGNVEPGFESSSCFGQASYDWGSNKGSLWAYMQCPSEEENSWFVNSVGWNVDVSSAYQWQKFGNVDCDRTVLNLNEKNCHISMLFRGYGEPFAKACTCPWNHQRMFVLEGVTNEYGSLQEFDQDGNRVGHACAAGFLGPKQIAQDSQGNMFVSDSIAGKVFRVMSDCSSKSIVIAWPDSGIGAPTGLAFGSSDTELYVTDASTGAVWKVTLTTSGQYSSKTSVQFPYMSYRSIAYDNGILYAAGQNYIYSLGTTQGGSNSLLTLVNPTMGVVDISDVTVNPHCGGVYFTADDNNQVWRCTDGTDPSTCSKFCVGQTDGSSCTGLNNPSAVALDCSCHAYVTSLSTGGLVRHGYDGQANVLSTTMLHPADVIFKYDESIYADQCCHTPLPTPASFIDTSDAGGCCVDQSVLFYIEQGDVYKVTVDGYSLETTSEPELVGDFLNAAEVVSDSQGGVFVVDTLAASIFHVSSFGVRNVISSWPNDPISSPQAIVLTNGGLYAVDTGKHKVWFISLYADFSVASITDTGIDRGDISDISVGPDGTVYVLAQGNSILRYDANLQNSEVLLDSSSGVVDIKDMAINHCGLYFNANDNNQVWHCSDPTDGSTCHRYCVQNMGQDGSSCYDLMNPTGVTVDCACNVYVASMANGNLVGYSSSDPQDQPHADTVLLTGQFIQDVEFYMPSCPPTASPSRSPSPSISSPASHTSSVTLSLSITPTISITPSSSPSPSASPLIRVGPHTQQCVESLSVNNTGMPIIDVPGCTIESYTYVDTQVGDSCLPGGATISRDFVLNSTCGVYEVTQQINVLQDTSLPVPVAKLNVTCCDKMLPCGGTGYYEFEDCDENIVVVYNDVVTDTCYERTLNRTWTACDCNNNCLSKSQVVVFSMNVTNNA